MLQNKDRIKDLKFYLRNKTDISFDEFKVAMELFCRDVLGCNIDTFIPKRVKNNYEYEYNVPNRLLVRWGNSMDCSHALSILAQDIDYSGDNYEWGILLCGKGIWLLNRDVKTADSFFASKKTVFKILFANKTDLRYLEFFNIDYLIGRNPAIYYFRDMITYKNTGFPSSKSDCWDVYWSCNKRFFAYYVLNGGGKYTKDSKECYENISLCDYEGYIRKNKTIKTPNTAKNQFFYIKSFILSQAYNKEFDIGSGAIIERCKDVLNERDKKTEETDVEKIANIIRYIEKQRNGVRNKTVFLIILCFGVERRKVCTLKWNQIDEHCTSIRIGGHSMIMPHILQKSIKELKALKTKDAEYVFGNSRTGWLKPLPENGINGILECIRQIDEKDEFYDNFSPANIRKWLFRFLLKRRTPLQDVLVMMNVPICNIENFIDNDELWEYSTFSKESTDNDGVDNSGSVDYVGGMDSNDKVKRMSGRYLMDDFMKEVERLV